MKQELLAWFDVHRRDLPWRRDRTPYRVWVAEIMLQQTRVETVIPYYERWMRHFPDVQTLACASEQEVLKEWEGLGYYSRARALHRAAKQIEAEFHGELPRDTALLKALPGIGPYSAGAISSIAWGKASPALDGNIRRILTRCYDIAEPIHTLRTEKLLWQLAAQVLDQDRPGDFNEALMDLGSSVCLPAAPHCELCPIREDCLACARGTQNRRPVQTPALPIPHYEVTAAVIQDQQSRKFLLARRPANGLLGNLWEYPGGKQEPGETLEQCLAREIREELEVEISLDAPFGVYRHAYTHFKVTLHAYRCHILSGVPRPVASSALVWAAAGELSAYPMGKIDRRISENLVNSIKPEE